MKVKILGVAVLALMTLGLGAAVAPPQAAETVVVADIPFAFTVEKTTLPAGRYEFSQAYDQPWEWTVADAKGAVKVIFETEPAPRLSPPKAYELGFDVVGGKYFLNYVWLASESDGFYVPMVKAEKALIKKEMPKKEKVALKKKGM